MRPGAGLLLIWHGVDPAHAQEVREWYAREHHFERLDVPGFVEARRFDRLEGEGGDILALYRTESPAVLTSPAYRERLAQPTERTRALMPHYRGMCRTVCRVAAVRGRAEGGHLAALASEDAAPDVAALIDAVADLPGVLRVTFVEADAAAAAPAATGAGAETALRGGADRQVRWAVLVDADSLEAARAAAAVVERQAGTGRLSHSGCYRLAFAARNGGH